MPWGTWLVSHTAVGIMALHARNVLALAVSVTQHSTLGYRARETPGAMYRVSNRPGFL